MSEKQRTHAARKLIESNPLAEAVALANALAKEKRAKHVTCRVRQTAYELALERCNKERISLSTCIDELLLLYGQGKIDLQ